MANQCSNEVHFISKEFVLNFYAKNDKQQVSCKLSEYKRLSIPEMVQFSA